MILFGLQESWRGEIEECLSKLRIKGTPPNNSELIQQREEELKHAQDIRVMYEQKLTSSTKNSSPARVNWMQRSWD